MLKRLHILCLALLAAATLSGCHRYLAREVRIVPKDIETYGSAGADVTLHVANRGGRPLRFEAAALSLAYDGGEVLRATLRDTVTVRPAGRATCGCVAGCVFPTVRRSMPCSGSCSVPRRSA